MCHRKSWFCREIFVFCQKNVKRAEKNLGLKKKPASSTKNLEKSGIPHFWVCGGFGKCAKVRPFGTLELLGRPLGFRTCQPGGLLALICNFLGFSGTGAPLSRLRARCCVPCAAQRPFELAACSGMAPSKPAKPASAPQNDITQNPWKNATKKSLL